MTGQCPHATYDPAEQRMEVHGFPETAGHRLYDVQAKGVRYDIPGMLSLDVRTEGTAHGPVLYAYLYGPGRGCYAHIDNMSLPGKAPVFLHVVDPAVGHVLAAMLNAAAEA